MNYEIVFKKIENAKKDESTRDIFQICEINSSIKEQNDAIKLFQYQEEIDTPLVFTRT